MNFEADKLDTRNSPELKHILKEKQSTEFYNKLFNKISKTSKQRSLDEVWQTLRGNAHNTNTTQHKALH